MRVLKHFSVAVGFMLAVFCAKAQNEVPPLQYDMTFKGRGEATTVQSVTVENLSSGESLTLDGKQVLRLTNAPSVGTEDLWDDSKPKVQSFVYPNPSYGQANLVFANRAAGNVTVGVYSIQGKALMQGVFRLETGKHTATLPAMPVGTYIVSLRGNGINESVKWTSMGGGEGGNISLSGQADDADPMISEPEPQFKSKTQKADDIVEMFYADGELLRFTGKNNNMTTVVMNIPTLSHDIIFDFYTCTDAGGYHYTIVNAGGILWMAEDLRNVPVTVVPVRADQQQWASYPADQPKQAFYNFNSNNASEGGYYNHAGAKIALPAGWTLPTAGEVDYMLNKLGGYERAANKLKARGDAWAQQQLNPDTVSFGAMAYGFLTPEGVFEGEDFSVKYWTRSTKNTIPIPWGIENQDILLDAETTAAVGHGLRVRGCRPAPSAYNEVTDLFIDSTGDASMQRSAKLFENGPLGGSHVITSEKKKFFADYSQTSVPENYYHFYHYDYTNGTYTPTKMPNNGLGVSTQYLKKSTAVKNSNSRENLVVATWNRPARFWTIQNTTPDDFVYGTGTISLITYADSTAGYARVDSIALPGTFTMENHTREILDQNTSQCADIYLDTYENYLSRFQVLAADFDSDGTDEIVIHLGNKVTVYRKNGLSWTQLYTKTFTTYSNSNVRITVGDADGDKTPDIAATYEESTQYLYQVELYSAGNISQPATAVGSFQNLNNSDSYWEAFEDIKIGNVTGSGINTIAASISRRDNAPTVCLFEYDGTAQLKKLTTYSSGTVLLYSRFNNNLTLVNFDGTGSRLDVVAGLDILTYSPENGSLSKKTNSTILPTDGWFVLSDNIFAGNFDGNDLGKEQLSAMTMNLNISIVDSPGVEVKTEVSHDIYDFQGSTFNQISDFAPQGLPVTMGVSFSIQGAGSTIFGTNTWWEETCVPFTGIARSAEAARTLKYVEGSYTVTMTEPRIQALLAAPPFFKYKTNGEPLEYGDATNMGTSWGSTKTSGTGQANESSNRASLILGFEQEFSAPVLAIRLGGVSLETSLESEWTNSLEQEFETSQGISWNAPNNDAVILTATFYDSYEYEIIASTNPDETGGKISISIPAGAPRTMGLNLEDYNRLAADNPECPDLRQVFVHKVGYPFTYPNDKNQVKSNLQPISVFWEGIDPNYDPTQPMSEVLWANNDGQEFYSTGSGNDMTRDIEMTQTTTSTTGFSFNFDTQLAADVLGIKIGAGSGYSESSSQSHSEGVGHGVSGTVPSPQNINDAPSFQWTLAWYKYSVGNQEFPVVYYVVKP